MALQGIEPLAWQPRDGSRETMRLRQLPLEQSMNPGTPFSLLLLAAGGILAWGVEDRVEGIDLVAVGVILLAVGALGLALSLTFWSALFSRPASAHSHDDFHYEAPPVSTYVTREHIVEPVVREQQRTGEVLDYREERHAYRR